MTRYAELQAASNFSFLSGASHADELVAQAAALGLEAIAITDRNTLAGVVRAHIAARKAGVRLVVGARLEFTCGTGVLCLPTDRAAYGRLARLLTLGKRRAAKGGCRLTRDDLYDHGEGQIVVVLPPGRADLSLISSTTFARRLEEIRWRFGDGGQRRPGCRHRDGYYTLWPWAGAGGDIFDSSSSRSYRYPQACVRCVC